MRLSWLGSRPQESADPPADRVRAKYASFRELLALNNESLELMAGLQEDLPYAPPRREVLGDRLGMIFHRIRGVVSSLERLTGISQRTLVAAVEAQQNEIERYAAGLEERATQRLFAQLSELDADSEDDVGSKAAVLGEIRNRMGLPVPDGFVLTTEAYRQYCGVPLWKKIRDAVHDLNLNDTGAVKRASESLTESAKESALPAPIAAAIAGGTAALFAQGGALAVRSSARGEGNARSYAGQFLSLLNVPCGQAVDAYAARDRGEVQRAGPVLQALGRAPGGGRPDGGVIPQDDPGPRGRHHVHARPRRSKKQDPLDYRNTRSGPRNRKRA